jgi:hypothetical protein
MTDVHTLDINATFRGGGSVEFLDQFNKASMTIIRTCTIFAREYSRYPLG